MGDVNYFGERDHYIFICYKDMIKLTYPVLLYELIKDYYDDLKDYIDLDRIKNHDIYNLERVCAERLDINPLKYLKKPGCPDKLCDDLLTAFNEEMVDIYTQSRLSNFGAKLYNIFPQERIKEFYIYVEEPNYQVIIDCEVFFKEYKNKIKFFTGDFIKAVEATPYRPTCYVLNDINYLHQLIERGHVSYTEIILGDLGCNYQLNDEGNGLELRGIDDKIIKEKVFKIAITPVVELEMKHFTALDDMELKK